jgi:LmbE family N-acetylglucosaminyl deacetylase
MVIAPHADDETIGVGGTLLRHLAGGDEVHWLLATASLGKNDEEIGRRIGVLENFGKKTGFTSSIMLRNAPARLKVDDLGNLIEQFSRVLDEIMPEMIYLPFPGDVHSDHGICFKAALAASKSFRRPFVKETRVYETISETNFAIDPSTTAFRPNLYVDISEFFEKKRSMVEFYRSEFGEHPFPRSIEALEAVGILRGSECNSHYAEAFMILKKIDK